MKDKIRRWPKDYFVETINSLEKLYNNFVFLLFIGPDENIIGEYISNLTNVIIVKKQSLDNVSAVISRCKFFLNSESGLGHIASCFDSIIFSIFGPANSERTKPYSKNVNVVKLDLPCQPCWGEKRKKCKVECLRNLTPTLVIERIKPIIDTSIANSEI